MGLVATLNDLACIGWTVLSAPGLQRSKQTKVVDACVRRIRWLLAEDSLVVHAKLLQSLQEESIIWFNMSLCPILLNTNNEVSGIALTPWPTWL